MDEARYNLFLIINFGLVSAVLDVAGLISYFEGFDMSLTVLILVFGAALTIVTIFLAHDFGYIDWEWAPL